MAIKIPFASGGDVVKKLSFPSFSQHPSSFLQLKVSNAVVAASDAGAFWTSLAASHTWKGYEVATFTCVANTTEQTIVDVTSAGVLTSIISPVIGGGGTITLRITIDGVVTTLVSPSLISTDRFLAGAFGGHEATLGSTTPVAIGARVDSGFDQVTTNYFIPTPPQAAVEFDVGMVFKESLKVTVQGSVNLIGVAELNKGCVSYLASIPEGLV